MFTTLHTLFETQYAERALATDEIAERIRSLGAFATGSHTAFQELSDVMEETGRPSAHDMIRTLTQDQATVAAAARRVIEAAEAAGDQASADLGTRCVDVRERNAWMLRSHLAWEGLRAARESRRRRRALPASRTMGSPTPAPIGDRTGGVRVG